MRTGEVATAIGVDSQTVLNWLKMDGMDGYISEGGRGVGLKQKTFSNEDIIILNTIKELTSKHMDGRKIEWHLVFAELQNGYRNHDLPQFTIASDGRSVPMGMVRTFTDLVKIEQERDAALNLVSYLKEELDKKELMSRNKIEDLERQIRDLFKQIGRLEAQLEAKSE